MPPKKNPETQAEQSARFKKDARKLVKDGALSLTEGEATLDKLVKITTFGTKGGTRSSTKS